MEIWKPLCGDSKKYLASSLGKIKTLNYKRSGKEKILKESINPKGYSTIHLTEENKKYSQRVNRLIAQTFIENPNNLPQVNHKNGIKTDSRVCNLEWTDNSGNQKHAYKTGLRHAHRGANNKLSKKVNQYDLQGNYIKTWNSISEAKKELSIANGSISAVCKGQMKQTGNYIWKYHKDTK